MSFTTVNKSIDQRKIETPNRAVLGESCHERIYKSPKKNTEGVFLFQKSLQVVH